MLHKQIVFLLCIFITCFILLSNSYCLCLLEKRGYNIVTTISLSTAIKIRNLIAAVIGAFLVP